MGSLGTPTSAPGGARPSLSVSVVGLLLAPVMSSLDQSQRRYPEVNKLFLVNIILNIIIHSGDWCNFVTPSC